MEFKISDIELQEINKWKIKHQKYCSKPVPTLGEHWYYKFIPTGLGNLIYIGCALCDEEKCVTDTEKW